MDTFRIDYYFDKNDFIRQQLIRWKILNRKNANQLIKGSIVSIATLSLWLMAKTKEEPTNLFLFIGIFSLTITLVIISLMIFSKRENTRRIKEIAEKYDSVKMDCTYEFSDESMRYWDKEKKMEYNWSAFTNYSLYKNYLFLMSYKSIICFFEKEETGMDEYNKILEVVKSKLEYKMLP